jgi:hypothetical protein
MYALSELKNKWASLASEIAHLNSQLLDRKRMLIHVDAALKILDPSIDIDPIPPKRPPKYIRLFRQGELGRMILDAIRPRAGRRMQRMW